MKRFFAFVAGFVLLFSVISPFTAHAAVNDFTISDYQIDYYLDRDSENRSTLRVVEKITAEFPQTDQNHGIERAIPKSYDGHSVDLRVVSVTDESKRSLNYTTYDSNGNEVLRIGDADRYVHGAQTYVITYDQRDVTRYFADTDSDEFYWDTNGTEWGVPIQNLTARLHVSEKLTDRLTTNSACYQGRTGAQGECELQETSDGVYEVVAQNLSANENVTIAVGFMPGTFSSYQPSLAERFLAIWVAATFIAAAVVFVTLIIMGTIWSRIRNRKNEMGTVVPEYTAPKDASVGMVAEVIDSPRGVMTAQLLDLAVRHYIKIYEVKEKTFWQAAEYEIEIVKSIESLKWEEQELLKDMFGGSTDVGAKFNMKKLRNSTAYYNRTRNNDKDFRALARGEYRLRGKDAAKSKPFGVLGIVLLILGLLMLSIPLLIASVVAFVLAATLGVLTDKGLELRRYAEGLKLYISVAEEERIKLLQSPEGAEKIGVKTDVNDHAQLIKLYEKVLPYAVLFGLEKQWNAQLGRYYEAAGTQPDWYSGNAAFNAAVFSSAMSSFSTSTSYASSSSSSSGGSGGGGSSGGGGGGGGGGGW